MAVTRGVNLVQTSAFADESLDASRALVHRHTEHLRIVETDCEQSSRARSNVKCLLTRANLDIAPGPFEVYVRASRDSSEASVARTPRLSLDASEQRRTRAESRFLACS